MIHDASFQLEEAMSAVELFDPKMDAGIGAASLATVAYSIATDHHDNALPAPASLSHAAQCDVADALLAREVEFYAGETLAETVLTCLYVHVVDQLPPPLHALLHSTLRACALAADEVALARISVEEDFIHSTQGFALPPPPLRPLDVAALTAPLDAPIAALAADTSSPDAARLALRLELRRAALVALARLADASLGGPAIALAVAALDAVLLACERLRVELAAVDAPPEPAPRDLHAYRGRGSSKLAVPDSIAGIFDHRRARQMLRPFPPRHVRRRTRLEAVLEYATLFEQCRNVLRSVFRDPTTPLTPELAATLLGPTPAPAATAAAAASTAADAAPALAVARVHAVGDAQFMALVRFGESATAMALLLEKRRANAVARSFLARITLPLSTVGGFGDGSDFVLASVRALWSMVEPELATRIDAMLSKACDLVPQLADLVGLLGKVERNWFHFRCTESGQQRRKLAHVIQDYGELQRRLASLDDALQPIVKAPGHRELILLPLGKWLNDRACTAIVQHTELSIAQGLFEPWELPQAYWQLEHYFVSQHLNYRHVLAFVARYRLQQAREQQAAQLDRVAAQHAEQVKKGNKKRVDALRHQKEAEREAQRIRALPLAAADFAAYMPKTLPPMELVEAKSLLARGTLQALLAANVDAVHALAPPPEPLPADPDETDPKKIAEAAAPRVGAPRVALQAPDVDKALCYAHRFNVAHALEFPAPLPFANLQGEVDALARVEARVLLNQAVDSLKRARTSFESANKSMPAAAPESVSFATHANCIIQAQRDEFRALAATALLTSLNLLKWPAPIAAPRTVVLHITWPQHASYCVLNVVKLEG